jgi:hypothetical protein
MTIGRGDMPVMVSEAGALPTRESRVELQRALFVVRDDVAPY